MRTIHRHVYIRKAAPPTLFHANSPRETFRMAALEGFISDPEIWFNFLQKRNITVHSYHENEAEEVINICPVFINSVSERRERTLESP